MPPPPHFTIEDQLAEIGAHDDGEPGARRVLTIYLEGGHVLTGTRLDGGSSGIKSDVIKLLSDAHPASTAVRIASIVAIGVW